MWAWVAPVAIATATGVAGYAMGEWVSPEWEMKPGMSLPGAEGAVGFDAGFVARAGTLSILIEEADTPTRIAADLEIGFADRASALSFKGSTGSRRLREVTIMALADIAQTSRLHEGTDWTPDLARELLTRMARAEPAIVGVRVTAAKRFPADRTTPFADNSYFRD
jgi:hypothetical protein